MFLAVIAARLVRLTPRGYEFTGAVSDDGLNWRNLGTVFVPMGSGIRAGLAAASHVAGTLATAIFQSQYIER